jgi:hypothetical protein
LASHSPINRNGVALLSRIPHPELNGSRWATPPSQFNSTQPHDAENAIDDFAHRIERLMRRCSIRAIMMQPRRVRTTDCRHSLPIAPNLLDRNFSGEAC